MRTRAIPERFCGGDSLRRGAILSACTFTFTFTVSRLSDLCLSCTSFNLYDFRYITSIPQTNGTGKISHCACYRLCVYRRAIKKTWAKTYYVFWQPHFCGRLFSESGYKIDKLQSPLMPENDDQLSKSAEVTDRMTCANGPLYSTVVYLHIISSHWSQISSIRVTLILWCRNF